MNPKQLASALGKLGKGKRKNLSCAERARRRNVGIARLRTWHKAQGHKVKSGVLTVRNPPPKHGNGPRSHPNKVSAVI